MKGSTLFAANIETARISSRAGGSDVSRPALPSPAHFGTSDAVDGRGRAGRKESRRHSPG